MADVRDLIGHSQLRIGGILLARAVGLDPSLLSSTTTWSTSNRASEYNPVNKTYTSNTVTVTLSYRWTPELYGQAVTLTSSSTVRMVY